MFRFDRVFNVLSARVRRGDAAAAVRLRRHLARPARHIVRQTICSSERDPLLERWVQKELDRIESSEPNLRTMNPEKIVDRLAGNLCDQMISYLRSGARPRNVLRDTLTRGKDDSILELSHAG